MTHNEKGKPAAKNEERSVNKPTPSKPTRSRFRRWIPGLVFLAVLGAATYLVWRLFFATARGPDNVVTLSGRIEGDASAIAPKLSGRVVEIRVREGDAVKAGDTIALLDDEQIRAREDQARAALSDAEAKAKATRAQIAVLQEQVLQGRLLTEQARTDASGRVRQAESEVTAAEAELAKQEAAYRIAAFDKEAYTRLAATGAVAERKGREATSTADQQSAAVAAARRRVSFEVDEGEIFGMIGPDGAGKTTVFQILAGVMEATSGSAEIFNKPARAMRSQTGYLTQTFSLYPDLSVAENIRYIGDLRGVARDEIAERGHRYLEMFDMDRFSDRLAGQLSGGMKQKLALVCALVPQPRVLLLDEPTTGVDPVSRREFWDALAHLSADGLTILVATPYLDEAERCHRVALTHQGEIHRMGSPAELRESLHAKRLELTTSDIRETEKLFSDITGQDREILDVQRFGDRLDLLAREPDKAKLLVEEKD